MVMSYNICKEKESCIIPYSRFKRDQSDIDLNIENKTIQFLKLMWVMSFVTWRWRKPSSMVYE